MATATQTMLRNQERAPTPRGISVDKAKKFGWTTVDEPGIPFLADKNKLHICTTYQRTFINEQRVLALAAEWSWLACGSLIVSERDGKFWVIDGQHRAIAAMRRSDITELPTLVFRLTSEEEEAKAFYRVNCVRGSVSAYDKLRAQVAYHDPLAVDSIALMEQEGYKPSQSESAHSIRCIAAFLSVMKSDRGVLLKVWPLIAQLHDGLMIRKKVFQALVYIAKNGSDDVTAPAWRERVLRHGLNTISDAIDRGNMLYSGKGARISAIATLEIINKGVRANSRIHIVEHSGDDFCDEE